MSSLNQNNLFGSVQNNEIFNKISSSKYSVYQAHNSTLDLEVALKIFPATNNNSTDNNYLNEKKRISGLNHPNIIKVLETVDNATAVIERNQQEVSYISFELATNGELFDAISKYGPMSEILTRTIFHDLLNAVDYIHSQQIAHLDLKLENILLDKDFVPKIIDFDLSQPLDSKTLVAKGTSGYRAPEIKKGFCYNLKAADIYSLGVILFILFNGSPPYAEIERGVGQEFDAFYRLMRKNNARFWEIHSAAKSDSGFFFSEEFKELVNGMLTEEPRQRLTIADIKSSKWMQGPILSKESYQEHMKEYMQEAI